MAEFNAEYIPLDNNIEHIQNPIQQGINKKDIKQEKNPTFQNREIVDVLNDKPEHILDPNAPTEKEFDRKYYAFENLEEKNQPNYSFKVSDSGNNEHKIHFDTRDRNKTIYPNATNMTFNLPRTLRNIKSINFTGSFESYIQEFTEENKNLELVIQEEDRFDPSGNLKEFVIRIDKGGYANSAKLRTELNAKANIEPDFLHYPNGFADFANPFIASGNFLLNFNDFQGFKYDEKIQKYVNRRLSNTVLKEEDDIVEDNSRILSEADNYFNTAYRNTIGYSSFNLNDAKVAYYYPPLKKKVQDDSSFLPESVIINSVTYTRDDLEKRVLLDFQGLDDEVIIYLIDNNVSLLDDFRTQHTYLENPVNKYSFSIDAKNNLFQVSATQISEIIQQDINQKIDQFTSNSDSNIAGKDEIILQTKIKNSQQIEFYDIFQKTNASNLAIDYGSVTIDEFLDSNTILNIELVTNDNYDSIVKGINNDILTNPQTTTIIDDFRDYPSIQSSNSFITLETPSNPDITIPGTTTSSNLDSNTFVKINSNVTVSKIEGRIESGGYNIFEFTPQSNITGSFYLTPKYLVNQSNHLVQYSPIDNPNQLTENINVFVQSNDNITEALLIKNVTLNTNVDLENILTNPDVSGYPIAKRQKVRFKFIPSKTAIYNITAHAFPGVEEDNTLLEPVIHLYTDKGSLIGDQQNHNFNNENLNYYTRVSTQFVSPETRTSSTTNTNYALIQETLEENHEYYFTVRAQDADTFNTDGVKVAVYEPDDISSSFVNFNEIPARETLVSSTLGEVSTSNYDPQLFDFIDNTQFTTSNISLEYIPNTLATNTPYFLHTKVSTISGDIQYSNVSYPENEYYVSQHISTSFANDISNELMNIRNTLSICQSNDKIIVYTDLSERQVDIPRENMNTSFIDLSDSSFKDLNLVFHIVDSDISNVTINIYAREDDENNVNDYSTTGGSIDISYNTSIFDTSGSLSLGSNSSAKLGAFVLGDDDFSSIENDYVDYIYRSEDIYDFSNPPAVTMINTIEDNLIAGSFFQPLTSNITSFIDPSENDVINGYLSIPYLTSISGTFDRAVNNSNRYSFDNGIVMNGKHYFVIPNNNDTQHATPSYKSDISSTYLPSTLFTFFCKPQEGYLLGTNYINTSLSQNMYIGVSNGILEAGFGNGSTASISGDIQSFISSGDPLTISFLMNTIDITTTELGLYVNTSNIVSSNIANVDIGADSEGFLGSNDFIIGNYQGKHSNGHALQGELYRYALFRNDTANIQKELIPFLHSTHIREDGFKTQYTSTMEKYQIADYRFYQPEQTDTVNLLIPNLMTKHITPSKETPDEIFDSGALSNSPFYNSLQFYGYRDPSGYFSFDTSGVYYKPELANEYNPLLSEPIYIGNELLSATGEKNITNSIQPTNKDFTIFLDAYPDDLAGPYTLLQFSSQKDNPRLYLENSILYFEADGIAPGNIKTIPLDGTSITNKQIRVILSYQAKTRLIVGEIQRTPGEEPFEFRINSEEDYNYDKLTLGFSIDPFQRDIFVGHFRTFRRFDTYFDQASRQQLFEREDPTSTAIIKQFSYEPNLSESQIEHIDFANGSLNEVIVNTRIGDISHYVFDNELDVSSYNYTTHTHSGSTFYSVDLTGNTQSSFGFETLFRPRTNNKFVLFQSKDLIIYVASNQLILYSESTGKIEPSGAEIPRDLLVSVVVSYVSTTNTLSIIINNRVFTINNITLEQSPSISLFGMHIKNSVSDFVINDKFSKKITETYFEGDVYLNRFYDTPLSTDFSIIRQRLLNFDEELKNNFLELSDVSGVHKFELTDTNLFDIENTGDFVAIYTDRHTLQEDLIQYPVLEDYKNNHHAFVYQDSNTTRVLPLRENTPYYVYAGNSSNQNIRITLKNSYERVSGRRNLNYPSVYELEDLFYLDNSRLVPKTQTRLNNTTVILDITPELTNIFVQDVSGVTNYNPFDIRLADSSINFQVLDHRNQPTYFNPTQNELTYEQGKILLNVDSAQPVLYIYDSYTDLAKDLSGTNNYTEIAVPGFDYKWGGESGSNIFQQDREKNSSIKYYDSIGQDNLVQLTGGRSYYLIVRGEIPTQEFSYYLNISGDSQKITFRQLTVEELLTDISNSVEFTEDKLYNFTNIPTLFNGEQIAPSLIPYGDVQENDRLIYPTYSLYPFIISDDFTTNTLKPQLITIYNTFTDDATEKAGFASYINSLNNESLQNYMVRFINDFVTGLGLTSSQIADPNISSSIALTKVKTSFYSTYIGKLFNDYLFYPITLNNNQYIHHILLRSFEVFFENINVQYNDLVYDASTDISGLTIDDVYSASTRLAAKFMGGVDSSGSFIHTNYSKPINRIDGISGEDSYETSIFGNMDRDTFAITDATIITETANFVDSLITDTSNNYIRIGDLSGITGKVDTFMSNIGFSSYSADPSGTYYERKKMGFIHLFLKESGIPLVDTDTYSEEYRSSLIGCDSTFWDVPSDTSGLVYPARTIVLDDGFDYITNYEELEVITRGYNDAYLELKDINDDYVTLLGQFNGDDLNDDVREDLREYINTQYSGILPASFADRERFYEPLRFRILFRSSLSNKPEKLASKFNWGLGYYLGYDKQDTPFDITHKAVSVPRPIGDGYIYMILNEFDNKEINIYSLVEHQTNANRYEFLTPENVFIGNREISGNVVIEENYAPGRTLVENNNTAQAPDTTYKGTNKYFTKISYSGPFTNARIGEVRNFDQPLSKLEQLQVRFIDRYGQLISSSNIDYRGTITIRTNNKIQ